MFHTNNDPACYCSGPRELGSVELFCRRCAQWFHKRCLTLKNLKCIPFMLNYTFYCRNCNESNQESFITKPSNFTQMCVTALANLTCAQVKQGKLMFSKDKEILPYIDNHWEGLTSMPRRAKTWQQTVVKTMLKEPQIFTRLSLDPTPSGSHDVLYGLHEQDLTKIGPAFDMNNLATTTDAGVGASTSGCSTVPVVIVDNMTTVCSLFADPNLLGESPTQQFQEDGSGLAEGDVFLPPPAVLPKTRLAKRKTEQQHSSNNGAPGLKKVKSAGESTFSKLAAQGCFPTDHPFNKDGYRYHLAEADMHAPNRQEFDESNETAGKPIPAYMYRVHRLNSVLLSSNDRAPQLKLSDDKCQVTGEKGYSVIRATHGVSRGSWYYEATVVDQPGITHTRIGWSHLLGCLQAPVGYDKFSYSWRSRKGTRFHESIGKHYSDGYKQGDVLGFYIQLPEIESMIGQQLPLSCKDLPLIKFKNFYYYEEKDEAQKALKELRPLPGSKIMFYKNGVNQGEAYTNVYKGNFYPAISLYKNASVRVNFGPNFEYPPTDVSYKPMSERAQDLLVEQTLSDILFFVENEGKLTFDVAIQ